MYISRTSAISGITRTRYIPVNPDDYLSWKAGLGSVQEIMPYLNDNDREFILSGITEDEWDAAFSEAYEDQD